MLKNSSSNPIVGGVLDSVGRYFLSKLDYRLYGLIALAAVGAFCVWRRLRYRRWPTHVDCVGFVLSLAAMIGGLTVMVVFLLTKPPAIDTLSTQTLVLLGLLVPIVVFGNAYPRLRALLFPVQTSKARQHQQTADSAGGRDNKS